MMHQVTRVDRPLQVTKNYFTNILLNYYFFLGSCQCVLSLFRGLLVPWDARGFCSLTGAQWIKLGLSFAQRQEKVHWLHLVLGPCSQERGLYVITNKGACMLSPIRGIHTLPKWKSLHPLLLAHEKLPTRKQVFAPVLCKLLLMVSITPGCRRLLMRS